MVCVHFGHDILELDIPRENLAFYLKPQKLPQCSMEEEEIKHSLINPVGCIRLKDSVPKDASVVIIDDDRTRLTPQNRIIPFVLEELYAAGLRNNQIKIVIAYGTHRAMTQEEIAEKYGHELMSEIEIIHNDCLNYNNLIDKGVTSRSTKIYRFFSNLAGKKKINKSGHHWSFWLLIIKQIVIKPKETADVQCKYNTILSLLSSKYFRSRCDGRKICHIHETG